MSFERTETILFRHCDPAGIVFYPRYFEMINDTVEAWFADVIGLPFSEIHKRGAVPTAEITTRFTAPSRLGDQLIFSLCVLKVGQSSLSLDLTAHCGQEQRLSARTTLVQVGLDGRPEPWSGQVRPTLLEEQKKAEQNAT